MAVPKRKTPRAKTRSRPRRELAPGGAASVAVPELRGSEAAARRVRQLRVVPRPPGHRGRLACTWARRTSASPSRSTPWAATRLRARSSVGALDAVSELGVDVLLVGQET